MSDLHLGFRQYGSIEREEDFYNQFLKVCDEINKCKSDIVIIAGDLFNKPNPSPKAINCYKDGIANLNADIICTIKGNHTMVLRDNHFSIDDYFGKDDIYGYKFLDDYSLDTNLFALEGGDSRFSKWRNIKIHIDGITYRTNSNIDEFLKVQKKLADECFEGNFNILVVHQSFKEFCGFTGEELSIEDIDYSPYDVVVCGHIHSRFDTVLSDGTKFIQPGSIERMNTTEALDEQNNGKGFYLVDSEDCSVEFHQVECLRDFLFGEVKLETTEDLEKHLEEVDETVKKMKVPPIISYTYKNYIKNIDEVRNKISMSKENILLNNSNIDDETQEDISIEITDSEIPSVLKAIKMSCEKADFTKEQCSLAVDLHDALNNNLESVDGLLSGYLEKSKSIEKEKNVPEQDWEIDLEKYEKYFGGL